MTNKFVKPFVAVAAMSIGLAAPATAQIAKFHMMTPAMPGLVQIDRISSAEEKMAEFLGSTVEMDKETSASLDQMQDAESIVAGTGQDIERSGDERDVLTDQLGEILGQKDDNGGGVRPPSRPEVVAAADETTGGVSVVSRPEMGRQVIVKTRTKSPRGGSKIKSGALWSVGTFR